MGKREKKKSIRSRQKYPNLNPKYNLKLRRDYINTHYVNGVKSVTGKGEGIRGLNDEEKEWLNKFYGEYVNASFGDEVLMETPEENYDKMAELEAERDYLLEEIESMDPIRMMDERNELARRVVDIKDQVRNLDYRTDSYSRNNARNRCLLNKGKATNEVEFRSWEEFDQNTIAQLEIRDLELLNAYYAGLLDDGDGED